MGFCVDFARINRIFLMEYILQIVQLDFIYDYFHLNLMRIRKNEKTSPYFDIISNLPTIQAIFFSIFYNILSLATFTFTFFCFYVSVFMKWFKNHSKPYLCKKEK